MNRKQWYVLGVGSEVLGFLLLTWVLFFKTSCMSLFLQNQSESLIASCLLSNNIFFIVMVTLFVLGGIFFIIGFLEKTESQIVKSEDKKFFRELKISLEKRGFKDLYDLQNRGSKKDWAESGEEFKQLRDKYPKSSFAK